MKLSTKGRYGLRALIDLAQNGGEQPVSITSISTRQDISERYLEQLMSMLKKAGIVRSVRGAGGGYVLVKRPVSYTHLDVYKRQGLYRAEKYSDILFAKIVLTI